MDPGAGEDSRPLAVRGRRRSRNHPLGAQAAPMRIARMRIGEAGFTLIEALVALALTGLVLSALGTMTAQWLPNWNRGLDRIQQSELIGIALQRIGADLAAAEYVPANRGERRPIFEGSELSVTFVRSALGPNAGSGLDVVRVGETREQQG